MSNLAGCDVVSVKENTQHIYDLVALCAARGVEKAVVCPGSRCAPLLLGFGKHSAIETISVTDERSAGFIGLGIAQQTGKPVVLVCTSGTAALNFAPAVTEAFYQNVQLIVLTADRPAEWIDQWDGQTIHQSDIYQDHVSGSYTFTKENQSIAEEVLSLDGPVHLNVPIAEPFYPDSLDEIKFGNPVYKNLNKPVEVDNSELQTLLLSTSKVMILAGQSEPNVELFDLLNSLEVPVVTDVTSNLHTLSNSVNAVDALSTPDLLITIGRSIINKKLKLFLRENPPKVHWHIGTGMVGDPFSSLTETVNCRPEKYLKGLKFNSAEYRDSFVKSERNITGTEFNYFTAVEKIITELPENSVLHLGNGMPVRIVDFIGLEKDIDVFCNRGTSGIDGVVSSAVGHALADNKAHMLIVGDLSFFYDRNGLWLNHEFPANLQIVVLNDGGGGIFNMISGPVDQGELTKLFTVPHNRTAELTADEFGLKYKSARAEEELIGFKNGILEIFTDMETNRKVFKSF